MLGSVELSPFQITRSTPAYTPSVASDDSDTDSEQGGISTPDGNVGQSALLYSGGVSLINGGGIPTPPNTVFRVDAPNTTKHDHITATVKKSVSDDPFVVAGGNAKLSASAPAFNLPLPAGPAVVTTPTANVVQESTDGALHGSYGLFSTDIGITRALKITGLFSAVQADTVDRAMKHATLSGAYYSMVCSEGSVYVRCNSINDAQVLVVHFRTTHKDWTVTYVHPNVVVKLLNSSASFVSPNEGQISVLATIPENFDQSVTEVGIVDLLATEGAVFAYQKQACQLPGRFKLIIEFADVNTAMYVLRNWHGKYIGSVALTVTLHRKDDTKQDISVVPNHALYTADRRSSSDSDITIAAPINHMAALPPFNIQDSGHAAGNETFLSPTGRTYIRNENHGPAPAFNLQNGMLSTYPPVYGITNANQGALVPFNGNFAVPCQSNGVGQFPNVMNGHNGHYRQHDMAMQNHNVGGGQLVYSGHESHNHYGNGNNYGGRRHNNHGNNRNNGRGTQVDIDAIFNGRDIRCTIMLRNIPNKVTMPELKEIIDRTSFGLYDFSYLRIDFANECNVGYAFVNFENPIDIVPLVKAIGGRKWRLYNSDKVAEISYATVQGRDCLIGKFRNSSVMTENPLFRPKLWYTKGHPLCGTEEEFPLSDNEAKMKRSLDNAEHVGLFAPRGGQQQRDDQRRRHHSQWDRGTRMAELDEQQHGYPNYRQQYSGYGGGGYYFGAPSTNQFNARGGFLGQR